MLCPAHCLPRLPMLPSAATPSMLFYARTSLTPFLPRFPLRCKKHRRRAES